MGGPRRTGTVKKITGKGYKMQLDISRCNRIHPTEFISNDLFFEDVPSSTCSSKETFVTNSNVDPAAKLDATLVRVHQPLRKRRVGRYHKGDRVKVRKYSCVGSSGTKVKKDWYYTGINRYRIQNTTG